MQSLAIKRILTTNYQLPTANYSEVKALHIRFEVGLIFLILLEEA